jgi:hypothetical protein
MPAMVATCVRPSASRSFSTIPLPSTGSPLTRTITRRLADKPQHLSGQQVWNFHFHIVPNTVKSLQSGPRYLSGHELLYVQGCNIILSGGQNQGRNANLGQPGGEVFPQEAVLKGQYYIRRGLLPLCRIPLDKPGVGPGTKPLLSIG